MVSTCHHSVLMAWGVGSRILHCPPGGMFPVYPVLLWTYSSSYISIMYILTVKINNYIDFCICHFKEGENYILMLHYLS